MKLFNISIVALTTALAVSCNQPGKKATTNEYPSKPMFTLFDDPNRFADIQMLRYDVPGFENLSLKQKLFVYYLSEAALCGRDIIYDQNNKHNLRLRKTLEELYLNYKGDRKSNEFKYFEVYLKRFWCNNGIHHMYAENKIVPEFSSSFLMNMIAESVEAKLPIEKNDTVAFKNWLMDLMYNPKFNAKRVNKDAGVDQIAASANNFYEGLTTKEVEDYTNALKAQDTSKKPIEYGHNSKLVKENGRIIEKVWKVGGMYGGSISKIVEWLEKSITVAETEQQASVLRLLIEFYKSGDLKKWDEYNIAWVKDVNNTIDVINGFIEVYHDAKGLRANFEAAVEINDFEASKRMSILASNAQWFENNSPIDKEYKKEKVKGISYKLVNVAMEGGDMSPLTAIGVNLPNSEWIREDFGSKSVSLGNITDAYNKVGSSALLNEFCWDSVQVNRSKQYGELASKLHTALHEVIGHASGQMNKGVVKSDMGSYGSTLEEARADLVALYYLMDKKIVDLGLMPSLEVGKAEYDDYIRNGMMLQMRRLEPGANIEEDHMRNRQLVASWAYEQGKKDNVIEKKIRNGKTYFVINDYEKLRVIFGELLKKIQSIKSRGAAKEGEELVETYGVKVDKNLHTEVLKRSKPLNLAPYKCFIQPRYTPIVENGNIVDIKVDYDESFVDQMLRYSRTYSFLPFNN